MKERRFNRWLILRDSSPAVRRPSDTGVRTRVVAQCVCGQEAIVWLQDIVTERSTGCSSRRCRARWDVQQELLAAQQKFTTVADVLSFVDRWVKDGRTRDEAAAQAKIDEEEDRREARELAAGRKD